MKLLKDGIQLLVGKDTMLWNLTMRRNIKLEMPEFKHENKRLFNKCRPLTNSTHYRLRRFSQRNNDNAVRVTVLFRECHNIVEFVLGYAGLNAEYN